MTSGDILSYYLHLVKDTEDDLIMIFFLKKANKNLESENHVQELLSMASWILKNQMIDYLSHEKYL